MIVKYSSLNRLEKPSFALCNPGSTHKNGTLSSVVGILTDTEAEEISFNFNASSELNLRANLVKRDDPEDNQHVSSMFRAIQNRRLIFVDGIGYFMITGVTDGHSDCLRYKDVTAKSIDMEIAQKKVPYIENGTYPLYKENADGKKSILKQIVDTIPMWTIGHVDESISEVHRTFEDIDSSKNCHAFLLDDIQNAYECIVLMDCVDRKINVYAQDNYVRETDIYVTRDDLVNSLDIVENADDLYTAVTVLGNENVTISAINPVGTNTIYDFSYYLNWMSEGLKNKVIAWQKAVKDEKEHYYQINLAYYKQLTTVSDLKAETDRLDTQLTMYTRCRDNIIADPLNKDSTIKSYNEVIIKNGGAAITAQAELTQTIAAIDDLIAKCNAKKSEVQNSLTAANAKLEEQKATIQTVQKSLAIESYFTHDEFTELYNYIYEGDYHDDYVTITDIMSYEDKFAQMKTLFDRASSQLARVSQPTREFTVDVENFIFSKEFERWCSQLETGCLINVEVDDNDIAMLFLCTISINYDDQSLEMKFGNRFNKFDAKSLFNDVLGKISKSSNTLNYIKDIIFPIKNGELNHMREALQTSRDLTMGQALASENEEVVIDGSGYTGRKKLDDGTYDPHQIKINGKTIVFTADGWETCKTAIGEIILGGGKSFYGINAEAVIGDLILGNELHILDKDGKDLFTVMDGKISASVSKIEGNIDGVQTELEEQKKNSIVSTKEQFYQSSSSTALVGGSWSDKQPAWVNGMYIWRRTIVTFGDGRTEYSPSESGVCITGSDGKDGIPGAGGADGKTSYFHIKYSAVNPPSASQMTETPSIYIGTYVDFKQEDSKNPNDYTWARFAGMDGKNGIPGKDGVNGKTSYLHIAYANSADGTVDFSTTDSVGKKYIGQYIDFTEADSEVPSKYRWSLFKGHDGTDGVGVESYTTEYYLSTSADQPIGGTWLPSPPPITEGTYLWSRNTIRYTNGLVEHTGEYCVSKAMEETSKPAFDVVNKKIANLEIKSDSISATVSNTEKFVGDLNNTVVTNSKEYQKFLDGLNDRIIQDMVSSGEWANLKENISKIEQTSNGLLVNIEQSIKNAEGFVSKYSKYFNATIDGLEIGESNSAFKTLLSNTKLSFKQGNDEIAYISGNKLYITEAYVTSGLSIENKVETSHVRQYVDDNKVFCIQIVDNK